MDEQKKAPADEAGTEDNHLRHFQLIRSPEPPQRPISATELFRRWTAAAAVRDRWLRSLRTATPTQPKAVLGLIRWLRVRHDERTLPDAPAAQVARVVARWRPRFKVFRPYLLRAAAAAAGLAPEELLDHALAIGVLKAYAWQAEHWDELGPLPATDVDQLVRTVALQEADRYLRSAERDIPPPAHLTLAENLRAPGADLPVRVDLELQLAALYACAPRRERDLLAALVANPDATSRELAVVLGCGPSTVRTLKERLRRRVAGGL